MVYNENVYTFARIVHRQIKKQRFNNVLFVSLFYFIFTVL